MAKLSIFLLLLALGSVENVNDKINKIRTRVEEWNRTTLDVDTFYLQFICTRSLESMDISTECYQQMQLVCGDTNVLDFMLDAWSKYPYPGIMTASNQDFGAFDQCLSIDHVSEGVRVLGKQCTYGFILPIGATVEEYPWMSYCVPDACSAEDIIAMLTIDQLPSFIDQLVNDEICSTKNGYEPWSASSIAVLTLFCIFFTTIILSTSYEIYLINQKLKSKTPYLIAFSLITNGQKLTQTTYNSTGDQILAFNGLKVISMMWIIAGHAAAAFSFLPVTHRNRVANFEQQRYAQYLTTAHLGVDTFFFLSGFLLAYQYFKGQANKSVMVQIKALPQMIVHRYLRITPVVLMFFLYTVYLSQHIGNGPLFPYIYETFNTPCKDHWWTVFLYIQNYYNPKDICWVHLWYLSADWQLFLVAPLIMIPISWLYRQKLFNWTMITLIILNVFFFLLGLFVKLTFPDFDPEHLEYDAHSKLVTYFMGVMFGIHMRWNKDKPYIFRGVMNIVLWIVALLILLLSTVIFQEIMMNHVETHTVKSITDMFIKPFWALGLAFITYSCVKGYGGVVNWFLTSGWMQVFSKLTFCLYILHLPVIFFWLSTRRTMHHFSDFNLFFIWCGHFIISVISAAIWSLMFESPLINIERILLGGGRKRPEGEPKNEEKRVRTPTDKIVIVHKPPPDSEL